MVLQETRQSFDLKGKGYFCYFDVLTACPGSYQASDNHQFSLPNILTAGPHKQFQSQPNPKSHSLVLCIFASSGMTVFVVS